MKKQIKIARVIDVVSDKEVVLLSGHEQVMVSWNDFAPVVGDVYEVEFLPSFRLIRKLSEGTGAIKQDGDVMRWRTPNAQGHTKMEALQQRHIIKRAVRDYLDSEGFLEIDMPLLVHGTTPDAEIDSFEIDDRYLVTSTEYQIKRMEIGGFDRLYTLGQNYRKGDLSTYRNPEFTMLEWARVGRSLEDIEQDAEKFTLLAHKALGGTGVLDYQGHKVNLQSPWDRMSVSEAIKLVTGVEIHDFTAASFLAPLEKAGITVRDEVRDDKVFLFTILLDHIQNYLGFERPVFLRDWPNFLTSSAREHESGNFVERSELFIAGVEISDGFPSMTDYKRQQIGFAQQQKRRLEDGKTEVKLDDEYMQAMLEGFPLGAGMALGFDRLVMLLTDRPDIASVMAYRWTEV